MHASEAVGVTRSNLKPLPGKLVADVEAAAKDGRGMVFYSPGSEREGMQAAATLFENGYTMLPYNEETMIVHWFGQKPQMV